MVGNQIRASKKDEKWGMIVLLWHHKIRTTLTSSPLKNTWLSVYDFPSPVFIANEARIPDYGAMAEPRTQSDPPAPPAQSVQRTTAIEIRRNSHLTMDDLIVYIPSFEGTQSRGRWLIKKHPLSLRANQLDDTPFTPLNKPPGKCWKGKKQTISTDLTVKILFIILKPPLALDKFNKSAPYFRFSLCCLDLSNKLPWNCFWAEPNGNIFDEPLLGTW